MKRRILLLTILLSVFLINLNAQEDEKKQSNIRLPERVRITGRAITEPGVLAPSGYVPLGGNEQRVSLNLSKHFDGDNISSKADFEVAEGQTAISLNLSGSCEAGEITITIIQPNGDTMKSQKITNAADINWSTRIPIKEGDEKKFVGKWQLEVKSTVAYGHYNLNINSR